MIHTVVLLALLGITARSVFVFPARAGIATGAIVLTHPAPPVWLIPIIGAVLLLILALITYRVLRATKWHLGVHVNKTDRNDQ